MGGRARKLHTGIQGLQGIPGNGISGTSYNSETGVLTITFDDESTFQTPDIRGSIGQTGKGILSTGYDSETGKLSIVFTDSSTFQTGDLRGGNNESNGFGNLDGGSASSIYLITQIIDGGSA